MMRGQVKDLLVTIVAYLLYYARLLGPITTLLNSVQPRRNAAGEVVFPFVARRRSRPVEILMYHRVNDDRDPFFPATPVRIFERQMEYLVSHGTVSSLEEAVERMKKRDVPDNAVVVTFDDGYRDNYVHAFPILARLSLPATIFLATDSIGSGRVLWHERVFSAFRETRVPFLDGLGHPSRRYPLKTMEEKRVAHREVLRFLRAVPDEERSQWIERLIEQLRVVDRREIPDLMLTWDEVCLMHTQGMSFGSHTVRHPILSQLPVERVWQEIQDSKRIIEEKLGTPVTTFAYPSGRRQDFTEVTKRLVQEAGYLCAVTALFGTNGEGQDLFELRRVGPGDQCGPVFAAKLQWYRFGSPA